MIEVRTTATTRVCLLISVIVVAVVTGMPEQFCPLERNGNQCRAHRDQFKCGAFLLNLQGQNETLRWLGALPDILLKPKVKQSPALRRKILGRKLHKKSFELAPGLCNEIYANARCYSIMNKLRDVPLDTCAENMLNDTGNKTLGSVLCEKAALFAPGQNFQSFIKIGFYYSACGGEWTAITNKKDSLVMKEELCCRYDNGQGVFFRCDGSNYKETC